MSPEQFARLVAVAPPERAFRYQLLAHSGARRGEAWALRWADVDLESRIVRIRNANKGRAPRYPYRQVPLANALYEALTARRGSPMEPLFPCRQNWRRDLLLDCKKAGIGETWRIHDLRHTFGSWLAQGGIPLHQIRDLMGHQSIQMTERYAHLLPNTDLRIVRALDEKCCSSVAEVVEVGAGHAS